MNLQDNFQKINGFSASFETENGVVVYTEKYIKFIEDRLSAYHGDWIKVGKTHLDAFPDDTRKRVEYAIIENGKVKWRYVETKGHSIVAPTVTHWRYID